MLGHSNLADVLEKLETARKEMHLMKSEIKTEEEMKPQPAQPPQPIKMTLVKTSTGMMLTPLITEDSKLCIPVHIQQPPAVTLELTKTANASLSIAIPPDESAERRQRLLKRTSVEVLPDYPNPHVAQLPQEQGSPPSIIKTSSPIPSTSDGGLRGSNSDPHLVGLLPSPADPMISMSDRDLNSPIMFMQTEQPHEVHDLVAMETGQQTPHSSLVLCLSLFL
jgi:hypothetical protein